jgi:hypothetical protein
MANYDGTVFESTTWAATDIKTQMEQIFTSTYPLALTAWSPTLGGFSSNPTGAVYKYIQVGKLAILMVTQSGNGTSNGATFTISAPVASANNGINNCTFAVAIDNGVATATPVLIVLSPNSSTIDLYSNVAGGGTWTASGGKRTTGFFLIYEAA